MEYITSRSFDLPRQPSGMRGEPWFNLWGRRQWPYKDYFQDYFLKANAGYCLGYKVDPINEG